MSTVDRVISGHGYSVADLDSLCARLRGARVAVTRGMVAAARDHRLHLLLAASLRPNEDLDRLGEVPRNTLRNALRSAVVLDMWRERALLDLVELFHASRIDALLFKGASLAHTHYSSAHLRPREDVDILIAKQDVDAAERALLAGGWTRSVEADAELRTTQHHYARVNGPFGERLDLHWKIAIPPVFADAVGMKELWSRSVPIASLSPAARTVSPADALFLACVHRVAHHLDADELLWIWDIHLIATRLCDAERGVFVELATRTSMRAVCRRGLELASARFRTSNAAELIAALAADGGKAEPSAAFPGQGSSQVDVLRSNLASLGRCRERLRLLREHVLPPASYIKRIYPRWPTPLIPLAYLHRAVRGAPDWFRRA